MLNSFKFRRSLEQLEPRRVMASDWQNSPNALDIDNSGFVVALDALLVINDINQNGIRQLPAQRPVNYTGLLCDVNGDGTMSAIDALHVINAINEFPDAPTIDVNLSRASDLNGDQVVMAPNITYQGTANPDISFKVERLEGEQATTLQTGVASATGTINVQLQLTDPVNHLRFTVFDPRGRTMSTERVVRLGDAVTAFNSAMLETIRHTTNASADIPGLLIKPPPPMVAKYLAMVHGAMFDAINAIDQNYEGFLLNGAPQTGASAVAAAATAAHNVAAQIYNSADQLTLWDQTLAEVMATVPDGAAKTLGIQLGQQAASAMLANRANDGSQTTVTYTPGTQPGQWRPTAPAFTAATLPQWPDVTPFALSSGDQFRPAAPPALGSAEYAAAVNEVKSLGDINSATRTADQTLIANFWADGGGTTTPPGHWNQIAIDVGLDHQQTLLQNARMMALLNYALADAGIASWDAKYDYNLWRPIDAIRQADTDGNAATTANGNWTPLLVTPSFPSYTSGHSTFSAAAAAVLTELFGAESFTTMADVGSTGQWPPSPDVTGLQERSFSSFDAAAQEAGMSRIYGGIHYSFDNTAGLSVGHQVGQQVLATLLQPKP